MTHPCPFPGEGEGKLEKDCIGMAKIAVIIPAAGKGERFGGSENKTLAKLDGRPIFLRTVQLFMGRADVCQTILAVSPAELPGIKAQFGANLGFMGVKLVEGGDRRCDTVAAALAMVSPDAEYIAVHDAVRPCTSVEQIDAVFAEVTKTGAAILAAPMVGTVKRVSGSMVIEQTERREGLYEAQTPQVFRKDVLIQAYQRLGDKRNTVTDDAEVVELSGHPVSIVVSDPTNLKVTTKADITLANAILKSRPVRTVPRMGAFEEAQW